MNCTFCGTHIARSECEEQAQYDRKHRRTKRTKRERVRTWGRMDGRSIVAPR